MIRGKANGRKLNRRELGLGLPNDSEPNASSLKSSKPGVRKYILGLAVLLLLLPSLLLSPGVREARADSGINSYEQWIINVIYSTFRYQGKYYKAKSEYITKVIDYLNRDDIDLTAEEADNYINKIYRNVRRGIDEGYLYEVERTTPTEEPTEAPSEEPSSSSETPSEATETPTQAPTEQPATEDRTEKDSSGNGQKTTEKSTDQNTGKNTDNNSGKNSGDNNGNGTGKNSGDNNSNGTGRNSGDNNGNGTGDNAGDGTGKNTGKNTDQTGKSSGENATEARDDGLPRDENGAIILPEKKESDIDPGNGDEDELIKYEKNKDDSLDSRPDEEDADTALIYDEKDGTLYYRVDDADGGTYREIAHFLPDGTKMVFLILLIVCGVLTLNTIVVGGARKCFIFQQKLHRNKRRGHTKRRKLRKLLRNIMTGVAAAELLSLILAGALHITLFREDAVMESFSSSGFFRYEYAKFLEKQGENTDHESYEEFLFHAKSELRETLRTGKVSEDGVLSNPVAACLYKLRGEIEDITLWLAPGMAIGLLLSFGILWFLDGIRHRGVRKMSLALGITCVISLAVWLILAITKPFANIYVEPDYLYRFIHDLGAYFTRLFMVAGIAAGVLSSALLGVAVTMKKKLEN